MMQIKQRINPEWKDELDLKLQESNQPSIQSELQRCNMCNDPTKKILWIETDPEFAKTILIAMYKANNRNINVIQ